MECGRAATTSSSSSPKGSCEQLGLASASDVVDGAVVRMPKAYPIYDCGLSRAPRHDPRLIDPISNLHTVGRNGMHKYNNQDHSMLTAMMTLVEHARAQRTTSGR